MNLARTMACALAIALAGPAAAQESAPLAPAASVAELAGLWQAKRRFGPDERRPPTRR